VPAGKVKPTETREVIASRYELCEDLAQMLTDSARARLFELGIAEQDVLERMHQGLLADAALVTADEARWVIRRLAELLGWAPLAVP
jgi:Fe2+ transport system protein FeoA